MRSLINYFATYEQGERPRRVVGLACGGALAVMAAHGIVSDLSYKPVLSYEERVCWKELAMPGPAFEEFHECESIDDRVILTSE